MSGGKFITVDGNEAAVRIAHKLSEVIAIYPITPASPMGELSDAWSEQGQQNLFGVVPQVIEMQSEAGAAGAVHGALQAGALTTTFTASQGLLLMLPNMYKIAGELTPAVIHVTARAVATHALSIFGDHSDVMAARMTGWAMLASASVQEAHDLSLIAHLATLRTRVPFLHFFDGFRTSHEVNKIEQIPDEVVAALVDQDLIHEHRRRCMDPDRPVLRGTAQNPDVFFQAREAVNPFYDATPGVVQEVMDQFAQATGRGYRLFDYVGAADADRVVVIMGSGAGAVEETINELNKRGERVGLLKVRLFRPFCAEALLSALPPTTVKLAVLDRTKEPGSAAEPLFQDVLTAVAEHWTEVHNGKPTPKIAGGRYGLGSKEFTPAMVAAIFAGMADESLKRRFTVGIHDDVGGTSVRWDSEFCTEADDVTRAVFYGLGSDGTVGASKNSAKIIGENTDLYAQGYFVYDSKKAGSVTVSHLRFSPRPIQSTYLIERANFVACHQFDFLQKMNVLQSAQPGAVFLLNAPYSAEEVWDHLPPETQHEIFAKEIRLFVVDAYRVASEAGMGNRINTVMQTCFFAISGVLPREQAIEEIKHAIRKTYGKRGATVLEQNFQAVDSAIAALHEVATPVHAQEDAGPAWEPAGGADGFVERVTRALIAGRGDLLPVSAMPVDGTFPTATAKLEKRSIAHEIPIWDPEICIQCGLCTLVCPHAAIRMKPFSGDSVADAPNGFVSCGWKGKDLPGSLMSIQVAPDDCTGCGVCVDVCPAKSKQVAKHKAINMEPKEACLQRERLNWDYFVEIPEFDRSKLTHESVKGSQVLLPLFEFSGACAGCGETPYLKLMSQLFGDRLLIGNATGCSSIYGGNLPTTPWSTDAAGRGPAWNNSLFEDNAEFGLGLRLAVDAKQECSATLVRRLAGEIGETLATELLQSPQENEEQIAAQRERVAALQRKLSGLDSPDARTLAAVAEVLVRRSVWCVGGDGWAYDIGFGGLDHVLTSGRDVNILVLDTGVYSNTGGQASKSTPRAAVAKFATGGKPTRRKDLGMLAVSYGSVYVAQVAMGANPAQTIRAFAAAESFRGPSLILAYSHCIAHGINMTTATSQQKDVVATGFWPLYRYDPREAHLESRPLRLDSRKPSKPFKELAMQQARFAMLARSNPEAAERLFAQAQEDINDQWHYYEQMAGVEREIAPAGVSE
ncbi:Pyruvate-flavodoxin oxidoreductase [Posidoniimonas polymericola]|uniref:Pyruvate-flavodoxin oxidoreductase n=1 Tax=Posidoniimonas polymericola TaxID=2528002 RepID=A0A5C5YLA4_9BACT|nr:pyruvate:ferredoxin (flavodoxin) oxidoreductase [Posidoniimonas polymericola]TWT75661.1 Pyruvate-flavodoxin oxidoreductase [Posidoniimonas polymericola]